VSDIKPVFSSDTRLSQDVETEVVESEGAGFKSPYPLSFQGPQAPSYEDAGTFFQENLATALAGNPEGMFNAHSILEYCYYLNPDRPLEDWLLTLEDSHQRLYERGLIVSVPPTTPIHVG